MIDTVIFDLDGTLLNTLDDLADSVNHGLVTNNLPQRTKEEVRTFIGNGVRTLIRRAVPAGTNDEMYEKVYNSFREYYLVHMRDKTAPYDGIKEMLSQLKANGIKTGCVSNKLDEAVKELCSDVFGELIDFSKGAESDADRKPNPVNLVRCVEKLNSRTENCIYVGDSEVDFQTAENAGMKSINVLWGFRTEAEVRPFGVCDFVSEPAEIIERIKQ